MSNIHNTKIFMHSCTTIRVIIKQMITKYNTLFDWVSPILNLNHIFQNPIEVIFNLAFSNFFRTNSTVVSCLALILGFCVKLMTIDHMHRPCVLEPLEDRMLIDANSNDVPCYKLATCPLNKYENIVSVLN